VTVALIDTSIFCEILAVPGKASDPAFYRSELKARVDGGEILLLPMTTILETGNHIGQCSSNGSKRRASAATFVTAVRQAIDGTAPFSPTPFPDVTDARTWLSEFPDWASQTDARGKGSGLGDLTIKKEWERQCALNPSRHVYIWSLDNQLMAYDRARPL
jgi:hypothetical protein